jgi:hypothetical protein
MMCKFRVVLKRTFSWFVWFVGVLIFLRPAITTQPVGDDLINPFYQFYDTGGGFVRTLKLGVEYGTSHKFDIVGQVVFVVHSWLWLQVDHLTGWSHLTYYFASKWLVFALAVLAAASVMRKCCRRLGSDLGKVQTAWLVLLAFSAIVQIHAAWSNDPVANYPMSGYAAAAFGLFAIGQYIEAADKNSYRRILIASLVASAAILYYEINVVLILAVVPLIARSTRERSHTARQVIRTTALRLAAGLSIPICTVIWGHFVTVSKTANYGGTTIGSWSRFPKTTIVALISSLPGGGWNLTSEVNSSPRWHFAPLALFALVLVALLAISFEWHVAATKKLSRDPVGATSIVLTLALYWFSSTMIQTMTDKYQSEIVRIGQVYNFYAQGSLVVATFTLVAIFGFAWRPLIRNTALGAMALLSFVQFNVNSGLKDAISIGNGASRSVLEAYSDSVSPAERCARWNAWASGVWPEYYEQGLSVGLSLAYKHFYGSDFCGAGLPMIP